MVVARNESDNAPNVSTICLRRNITVTSACSLKESWRSPPMHSGIAFWGRSSRRMGRSILPGTSGHVSRQPGASTTCSAATALQGRRPGEEGGQWRLESDGNPRNRPPHRIRLGVNGQLVADWEDPSQRPASKGRLACSTTAIRCRRRSFRGLILSENPEDRMITVEK